jgi:TetR/AcrR family fatty acid metabolism transcriptional regulator
MKKNKTREPGVKRDKIINSALEILNTKEYYNCPMDEIARHAGVAKGTVYIYFKSKEDLYFSVLDVLIGKIMAAVKSTGQKKCRSGKKLLMLFEFLNGFFAEYRHIFLSIRQEMRPSDDRYHSELRRKFGELISSIGEIVQEGVRNKEFRKYPPALIASVFMSLASVMAHQNIEPGFAVSEATPVQLFEIFMKGIGL